MKFLTVLLIVCISMMANDTEKKVDTSKTHLKSIHKKELSKKELAYQKYKDKLEIDNKKLEDDGFCSCNNN